MLAQAYNYISIYPILHRVSMVSNVGQKMDFLIADS
jgi:hypothetical protein